MLRAVLALAVLVAAGAGILIGHLMWHNTTATTGIAPPAGTVPSSTGTNPLGSLGSSGAGGAGSGNGSSPGTPADASAIASSVDPGLVDVSTALGYQHIQAEGTGMVLTSSGLVLTNNHVIEGATTIDVTDVGNGRTYGAFVVGYDRSQDVAVLQMINASGLNTVKIASSSAHSGTGVVAIGNAGGSGGTPKFAAGSITATDRSITASDAVSGSSEQLTGLIETDAAIVAGDSGGPLVNSSGRVVGMDTAGSAGFQFQTAPAQGYAIPITQAMDTARTITSGSGTSAIHVGATAFLGVEVQAPTGGSPPGAEIAAVVPSGPAAHAGLVAGDTITSAGGNPVASPNSLTAIMLRLKPQATIVVRYLDSSGQQQSASVTLGSGPPQ